MPTVKMIATDLDDTLLRTDKTVSEYTRDVLRRCRDIGIKIVYATGRGGGSENIAPAEMFDGRIMNNGAVAVANGMTYKHAIQCAQARPLLTACDRRGLKVSTQLESMHYTNFDAAPIWPQVKDFEIVDFSAHSLDADKICILVDSPNDVAFIEKHIGGNMYLNITRDGMAMVMHKDASKAKALMRLAKMWGIGQPEIIAFGDDVNDLDMLSFAGVGVATGNALDDVKSAADFVCLSSDEDGVARWLEDNVLKVFIGGYAEFS